MTSWKEPSKGFKDIIGYRVSYKPLLDGGQESYVDTDQRYLRLSDLKQMTRYEIVVQARTSAGLGNKGLPTVEQTLDRDECMGYNLICGTHAQCINTQGSYTCKCPLGSTWNGKSCQENVVLSSIPTICAVEKYKGINWLETEKGGIDYQPCPEGSSGLSSRNCLAGSSRESAKWAAPDLSGCVSDWMESLNEKPIRKCVQMNRPIDPWIDDVKCGAERAIESRIFPMLIVEKMDKLISSDNSDLLGGDVVKVVDVLNILDTKGPAPEQYEDKEKEKAFLKSVSHVTSNLLSDESLDVWEDIPEESRSEAASKLMKSVESIVISGALVMDNKEVVSMDSENIVLAIQTLTPAENEEKKFPPQESRNSQVDQIIVPPVSKLVDTQGRAVTAAFVSYKNLGNLLHSNEKSSSIGSDVLSFSLIPKPKKTFEEPVKITFINKQDYTGKHISCVFWDSSSYPGSWSPEGCEVHSSNETHTVCHCYHLTSFALLMRVMEPKAQALTSKHTQSLSMLTYIGICISIVALLLAFVTFCFCRFMKSLQSFIHKNLAISLAIAELLFLFGIDQTENKLLCLGMAALLHYMFLVVFSWMAMEGLVLYLLLVRVFPTSENGQKQRICFALCWGLPAVVVLCLVFVFREGYRNDNICWLSVTNGFIWSFVGPVIAVVTANFVMLITALRILNKRQGQQNIKDIPGKFRYWVKCCGVLTSLLGVTWILGVFYVNEDTIVLAYLFNIFNSLQGLFIFIFHCLLNEKVRKEYRKLFCFLKKGDVSGSKSSTYYNDGATKATNTSIKDKSYSFSKEITSTQDYKDYVKTQMRIIREPELTVTMAPNIQQIYSPIIKEKDPLIETIAWSADSFKESHGIYYEDLPEKHSGYISSDEGEDFYSECSSFDIAELTRDLERGTQELLAAFHDPIHDDPFHDPFHDPVVEKQSNRKSHDSDYDVLYGILEESIRNQLHEPSKETLDVEEPVEVYDDLPCTEEEVPLQQPFVVEMISSTSNPPEEYSHEGEIEGSGSGQRRRSSVSVYVTLKSREGSFASTVSQTDTISTEASSIEDE